MSQPPPDDPTLTADQVVDLLRLEPHPEGGAFRETYRDRPTGGGRGIATAIYFLLRAGQVSRWHRVTDATELWHFYAGAPIELTIAEGGALRRVELGGDLAAGQRPQAIVPAGAWQSARSLGAWSLAGCTVSPAFEFSSFELAPEGWQPPADRQR